MTATSQPVSTDSTPSSMSATAGIGVDLSSEDQILVLDFGGQTAQLITRRVREENVFCQLVRHNLSAERIREINPKGIILSGGPDSVYGEGAPQPDPEIFDLGIPVLGICYGMQLACRSQGSQVKPGASREFGLAVCTAKSDNPLFRDIPAESRVWMSHGDQVENLSESFNSIATTETCPHAAVQHKSKAIYGLQFHPEVTHTELGSQLLRNFVRGICGCEGTWKIESLIDREAAAIRERVGNGRVICGLSGGVDSSVVAALLYKAIGDQLSCIFVDNGLLRKGEADQVREHFGEHFKTDLHVADARKLFLDGLAGVVDPQKKRKIIGKLFIDVFKEEALSIPDSLFLAQGTLYPDVIESGASPDGPAATIKAHHNVGGLPDELGFELIEPLRDFFKDEVRQMGAALGLPEHLVWRHPFPGPGLAVRCLGEVTEERLAILREADAIVIEELYRANLYREISQALAALLPIQSVGVMGDARTYESTIVVRAVTTTDFMTADWFRMPHDVLQRISTRITNSVRGINRVVYDCSSKPPSTIEWE